jgi:hypothetical protein
MAGADAVVVGIEGCRNGWVAVALDGGLATGRIFTELGAAAECHRSASLIPIAIPIGLLVGGQAGRECDRAAQQRLGWPRQTSVFSAPVRAAVEAVSFAAANARNRAACGRGLSRQSFAIGGKIAEVDRFLRQRSAAARRTLRQAQALSLILGEPRRPSLCPASCSWMISNPALPGARGIDSHAVPGVSRPGRNLPALETWRARRRLPGGPPLSTRRRRKNSRAARSSLRRPRSTERRNDGCPIASCAFRPADPGATRATRRCRRRGRLLRQRRARTSAARLARDPKSRRKERPRTTSLNPLATSDSPRLNARAKKSGTRLVTARRAASWKCE